MTAVPLFGVRRIQLNFMVEPLAEVPRTHNVTKVIHPVMWFEEVLEFLIAFPIKSVNIFANLF